MKAEAAAAEEQNKQALELAAEIEELKARWREETEEKEQKMAKMQEENSDFHALKRKLAAAVKKGKAIEARKGDLEKELEEAKELSLKKDAEFSAAEAEYKEEEQKLQTVGTLAAEKIAALESEIESLRLAQGDDLDREAARCEKLEAAQHAADAARLEAQVLDESLTNLKYQAARKQAALEAELTDLQQAQALALSTEEALKGQLSAAQEAAREAQQRAETIERRLQGAESDKTLETEERDALVSKVQTAEALAGERQRLLDDQVSALERMRESQGTEIQGFELQLEASQQELREAQRAAVVEAAAMQKKLEALAESSDAAGFRHAEAVSALQLEADEAQNASEHLQKQVQVLQDEVRAARAAAEEANAQREEEVEHVKQSGLGYQENAAALKIQLEAAQSAQNEAASNVGALQDELDAVKAAAAENQATMDREMEELQSRLQIPEVAGPVVSLDSGTPESSGIGRGRLQSRASRQGRSSPGSDIEMGYGEGEESELMLEFKPFAGVPWIPKESQGHHYATIFDKSSVTAGKELSRRPVLRATIAVYLIIVHAFIFVWYLTHSSAGGLHTE